MVGPDDTNDFFTAIWTLSGVLWVLSLPALQSTIAESKRPNVNERKARYMIVVLLAASVVLFADMVASLFRVLPSHEQGTQLKLSVVIAVIVYVLPIIGYKNRLILSSADNIVASVGTTILLLAIFATVFFPLSFSLVAQIFVATLGVGPVFYIATALGNIEE